MAERFGRRAATFAVAAAVLGALGALLIAELIVRAVPLVPDKSLIRYQERPGDEGQSPLPHQSQRTLLGMMESTNEHGLRDPTRALDRSGDDSLRRLALVGDSVVWGFGLEDAASLPRQMERHLARLDPGNSWQVWNLGQPATNQINHAARFARLGPRIQPEVVLIVVLFNDLIAGATRFRVTDTGYLAALHRNAPYPDWVRPLLDRSAVFHLAIQAWYAREKRLEPSKHQFLTDHMDDLLGGLGTTVEAARGQGAKVGLVLIPGRYEPERGYPEFAGRLARWSVAQGLSLFDLGGLLGVPLEDALALPGDSTHLNEVGAGRVAERLAAEVVDGLVPPP